MKKYLFLIGVVLISQAPVYSQPEIKESQLFPSSAIPMFDKVEIQLKLPEYVNNYNPDVIRVEAVFTSPSGSLVTVPGFYFQNYIKGKDFDCELDVNCEKLTKARKQPYNWVIRFSPNEEGNWKYKISATDMNGKSTFPLADHGEFLCIDSKNKGFIYQKNDRYLAQDGKHLFFVGENIAWYKSKYFKEPRSHFKESGTNDFKRYIDKLAENNANFIRVWINQINAISIIGRERLTGTLHGFDNYNQKDAWQLDYIMEYANEKGINVVLCLLTHTSFVNRYGGTDWKTENAFNSNNPRSKGNGINSPFEIFYDQDAIKNTRDLFRYIIARWGYSTNLIAWELWNEENQLLKLWGEENLPIPVEDYVDYVVSWHNSMADYIRETDPFDHLITTSSPDEHCCGDKEFPEIWSNMDMVITHNYKSYESLNYPFAFNSFMLSRANKGFDNRELEGKPYMCQEWGVSPLNDMYKMDPLGYALHCNLWSSAMSGSLGTVTHWSWDKYIHKNLLYYRFKPVSIFMNSIVPELDGTNRGSWFRMNGLGVFYMSDEKSNTIVGWCQDENYDFASIKDSRYLKDLKSDKPGVSLSNNKISIRVRKNKKDYTVKWYDSQTANLVWEGKVMSKRKRVIIEMPLSLRKNTFGDGVFLITKD